MRASSKRVSTVPVILSAPLALWLSACGAMGMSAAPTGSNSAAAATPRVQDCGIVSISSPSKFVCNGKVYTSFELAKLQNAGN